MLHSSVNMRRRGFLLGALASGTALLARVPDGSVLARGVAAGATTRATASLGPLINIPQTWNNCGPAAIAEVLAYWGISRTQGEVQSVLRVDGPVIGMTPYGVPAYARGVGLRALVGVGGTDRLVKTLVAAGLPIIVHQVLSLSDLVGHWRPVQSYDDRQGIFVTSDPYLGANYQIEYAMFDQLWARRGYGFIMLYPTSRQAAVNDALASAGWNKTAAYTRDLERLRAYQWDTSPAGAPASASSGYHFLALAWDAAQLGRASAARTYLQQATRAGANPIEARWIGTQIP